MSEIEHTMGVEQITWYRDDPAEPHRLKITYPNDRYPLDPEQAEQIHAEDGALMPAIIEMFGRGSFASMGIRTPEDMMEIAEIVRTAAILWNHEIGECGCGDHDDADGKSEGDDDLPFEVQEIDGGVLISMNAPLSALFGDIMGRDENEEEPEDSSEEPGVKNPEAGPAPTE